MMSPRVRTPSRSLLGTPARVVKNTPSSKIRVVCRIRPFLSTEEGNSSCLCIDKRRDCECGVLHVKNDICGRKETYNLDFCYGEEDHISYIFRMELEPVLPILFRGCNATVFAYGATGSGKTHTMQGIAGEEGLIPLSIQQILSVANAVEATVEVSYYEIYMDRCYDLLVQKSEISVLEDTNGRIQLRGLSQVRVRDLNEFQAVYSKGCSRRKVGQTGLNDVSSRSHAVLTITVATGDLDSIDKMAIGKLNLIDLAGNEDNRRSGNDGVRLAESSRINQSLFALSNVINALNSNETRIPYRDSKLTRILQDSLGGTSCALMIACLNPGAHQEAIHTLNLAAKSRQIINKFVETPVSSLKIDMEAKLRAWREEKGKTCEKSPAKVCTPKSSLLKSRKKISHTVRSLKDFHFHYDEFPSEPTVSYALGESISDDVKQKKEKLSSPSNANLHQSISCAPTSDDMDHQKENVEPSSSPQCTNLFNLRKSLPGDSPPLSAKLRCLGSSLREALSPLSSNLFPSTDIQSPTCESKTPLQKLNSTSRAAQDTLIKEYVEVLNKGCRQELLALRGIGEKRADYILNLRELEKSPIKELQDLQKIGLSEKLACTLFNKDIVRQIWATPK